ncbi:MAG: hypothetical protein JRE81_12320, partial [Deltaproteobacteria bacterium]|nr:hypothetical protein [Deltaproteobacteria bacterium]
MYEKSPSFRLGIMRLTSVFAVFVLVWTPTAFSQAVPGGTLDPNTIPKYVTPLVIPPVLFDDQGGTAPLDVTVSVRQIEQQVLPAGFPKTPLWAYGDPGNPATFNNPGFTIEVTKDVMSVVRWSNELLDADGNYLPHIIQDENGNPLVDQTLHWAAPNRECLDGTTRTDCRGASSAPYTGPIPMVVHVHGAHVGPGSDGYPEAWWLPRADDIDCVEISSDDTPSTDDDYACNGSFFESAEGSDTANAKGQGYAI